MGMDFDRYLNIVMSMLLFPQPLYVLCYMLYNYISLEMEITPSPFDVGGGFLTENL